MIKYWIAISFIFSSVLNLTAQNLVETLTSTRSQIILNGQWKFQPIANDTASINENAWGKIWVPGIWGGITGNKVPGIAVKNKTWPADVAGINKAWYQTSFVAPQNWMNKAVEITFSKISTDAIVFVNGQKAGTINWYSGSISIGNYVKYGQLNTLQVLVIATANQNEVPVLMGTAVSQVSFKKVALATKGITGDVIISARPRGVFISDVFVKTSFRKKNIEAEAELVGVNKAAIIVCKAAIRDEHGVLKKSFSENISVAAADTQLIRLGSQWSNPALWDLDHPGMYKLYLTISVNNQVQDAYVQSFGFREFWAEGKLFFLNGKRINLRPFLEGCGSGMNEIIDARIAGLKKNGFNFSEIWPDNIDERGFIEFWDETMNRADKKGYLLAGAALHFSNYIMSPTWSFQWDKAEIQKQFEKRMQNNLRRYRNHPSVVMWGTTGNFFGHDQDQNPVNIGRKNWITDAKWNKTAAAGEEAIRIIKKYDPTRLVFTHHGAYVGDIHTLNFYLNFLPLQEREEWMSAYSKKGEMPFMAVEFGTPLHCSFLRGRNGFGNNIKTEPLVTEFSAMYIGSKAYTNEPASYRALIKNHFIQGQTYKQWSNPTEMEEMWSFQQVQKIFSTSTWRSWRNYEVPGGMLPWNNGHGWVPGNKANKKIKMPAFVAGRRGTWHAYADNAEINFMQQPAWNIMPGGDALVKNNNSTLAYIGGSTAAFTAKDNHFSTGQNVEKQLFFFNDTRATQQVKWECNVWVSNKIIHHQKAVINKIATGEKSAVAIYFKTPENLIKSKVEGKIILAATIGNIIHTDTFSFRMYKKIAPLTKAVTLFDPVGKTKNMLQQLGYQIQEWKGETNVPLVLIGREVLSARHPLPVPLQNYIANGGKAIVFNQHPDSILHKRGFRTSQYISRYVFPVNNLHPVTKGLDEHDFRNWCGISTITEAYPDYNTNNFKTDGRANIPYYGWHWGNRGGVATGAIEKPHNSAWQPILECEFDMAYSPLMELPYKNGLLIWCALDVEDHAAEDPVAALVTHRLIDYAANKKTMPRNSSTQYMGDAESEKLLINAGVQYNKVVVPDSKADLLICGNINTVQEKQLRDFVTRGGKVLVLPRRQAGSFIDVDFVLDTACIGGSLIPHWKETAGLSISDVRYRAAAPGIKINNGCTIAIEGMMGKKNIGKGTIIFTQFNPDLFNADSLTYFRYTRWRQTRALSQVLANMGASFSNDTAIFFSEINDSANILLDGAWKLAFTKQLPGATTVEEKHVDSGTTIKAKLLIAENADETGMIEIDHPQEIETVKPEWAGLDGEMVFRKRVWLTKAMAQQDVVLSLGTLDDYDDVYVNGIKVAFTDSTTKDTWAYNRFYTLKAGTFNEGNNTIAIRIFDNYGGGGFTFGYIKRELKLKEYKNKKAVKMYHADYRDDYELGDDPFRYFRW